MRGIDEGNRRGECRRANADDRVDVYGTIHAVFHSALAVGGAPSDEGDYGFTTKLL